MKKFIIQTLLVLVAMGILYPVTSQTKDKILLTIADENITKTEFVNVYKKNNIKGETFDKKSLEEYLELFINFKLKVKEAEELKMDTAQAFITELAGYRKQLAQPYLTDKDVFESVLKEAYDRMQFDIRASHILIKVSEDANPNDTLIAYKKISEIRKRLLKGEDFGKLAIETSEDPSAKGRPAIGGQPAMPGNAGDLGYFTAMDMVYPFETGAYNTPVGEISPIIRTSFGYHIIKVVDKKPAMGNVQVAHIFFRMPLNATKKDSLAQKERAFEAYNKIKNGEDFDLIVKQYSDDKGSAEKGGVLPWFGVNRMVPEFIVAVAKLNQDNPISEPVLTNYGWHIIKIIERKPVGTFEEVKAQIKKRVARDVRANRSKEVAINNIKKEFGYKEYKRSYKKLLAVIDSTILEGKWDVQKANKLNKKLFKIGDKKYTQNDFAKYIELNQGKSNNKNISYLVKQIFNEYVDKECVNYKDSHLEENHPEFKTLMKEYRDGILLFELTDNKVWSKAIKDTAGLEVFYLENRTKYMWGERLDASIYYCFDVDIEGLARSYTEKGMTEQEILDTLNNDSITYLTIENKKFSKGDNKIIDGINWKVGITKWKEIDGKIVFVVVRELISPEPKLLNEAKGLVTADYQNYLEKEWIKQLKAKYPVNVDRAVFDSIK
ncbi:MAG: peptidylprolyl isomerase [Saprospiraceae bacterium]|nr:peptidylprolyl isomerase [Saprospiraceae bacterium]